MALLLPADCFRVVFGVVVLTAGAVPPTPGGTELLPEDVALVRLPLPLLDAAPLPLPDATPPPSETLPAPAELPVATPPVLPSSADGEALLELVEPLDDRLSAFFFLAVLPAAEAELDSLSFAESVGTGNATDAPRMAMEKHAPIVCHRIPNIKRSPKPADKVALNQEPYHLSSLPTSTAKATGFLAKSRRLALSWADDRPKAGERAFLPEYQRLLKIAGC